MAKELLSGKEVDRDYGLTEPWLRKMRRLRRGPRFIRVGKLVKYRRTHIEEFLRAQTVEPMPQAERKHEQRAGASIG